MEIRKKGVFLMLFAYDTLVATFHSCQVSYILKDLYKLYFMIYIIVFVSECGMIMLFQQKKILVNL